ncbi:MAG TPA: DUF2129 domain-containing protein [Bacillota bacterium]|nr:DUF2129 domain-containing protein [Bacillota bacterium]HPF42594.1 DUF2129 domain-containing protein [Bacillota bacterium]HPJ86061.1 DUF2129 domain-containing protein [Bacillota bacterium]HPQ62114.1 DUF2129 domain-containing protein [Bacillota bacterium]HRX91508.1 DUF2129 domain-containing protein [Candidatus Izemoplasmatales bacterium]
MVNRKGIIVYFQSKKIVKEVEKTGVNVVYINPKAKYLTGYIDASEYEKARKQIQKIRLVRKVEESLVDMEEFSFNE